MKTMNVAVIGCGSFAQCFVPLFQAHPTVDKVFVCDLDDTKAKNYKEKFNTEIIPTFEEAIAREDERVFYGGMLLNTEIVAKEQEATLLVNPRPTQEEFVKYSFPSKTMEYMASGTPVMTTVLPGMPREYHPHVFLLRDETAVGIAASLKEVLALSDAELYQKGC